MLRPAARYRGIWLAISLSLGTFSGAKAAPLDGLTNVGAAFGLRQLRAAYSGPLIRVRRSSDNTESDIGFTGTGALDTATLLSFSGASGNAFVTTWYDQSGNARNMVQSTQTRQPQIVSAAVVLTANGSSAIYISGDKQMAVVPATWLITANGDRALNAVIQRQSGTIFAVWSGDHSGNQAFGIDLSGYRLYAPYTYGAGDSLSASITAGTMNVVTATRNAGVSAGYLNGVLRNTNTAAISTTNTPGLGIGTRPDGAQVDGYYLEIVYFTSALSTTARSDLESNQVSTFLSSTIPTPTVQIDVIQSSTVQSNDTESTNWKNIPSAVSTSETTITNRSDSPDSSTVVMTADFSTNVDAYTGTGVATPPVTLTEGTPACGLSFTYSGLASSTDSIDFLDSAGTSITPTPDGTGFAGNVRKIRVRLSGTLNPGANGNNPNCRLATTFRVK